MWQKSYNLWKIKLDKADIKKIKSFALQNTLKSKIQVSDIGENFINFFIQKYLSRTYFLKSQNSTIRKRVQLKMDKELEKTLHQRENKYDKYVKECPILSPIHLNNDQIPLHTY